jgi:hypothetical protein
MPVGYTSWRSVQVPGFAEIGLLTPPCRLDPIAVRQASVLPTASSRFHLTMDTLAVQLTLPLAGCVGDLHPQVSAPCRAHQKEQAALQRERPASLDSKSQSDDEYALRTGSGKDHADSAQNDLEIQPEAPVFDVVHIQRDSECKFIARKYSSSSVTV